jgi:hypothetical protein
LLLIFSSNSLRTQKASFFSRVPVELNGSLRLEAIVDKGAERLEDSDCATAIVLVSPKGYGNVRDLRNLGESQYGILLLLTSAPGAVPKLGSHIFTES